MDSHYGYTPVYAPTQPPETRHGFTPVSTGFSSSGPNLSAYTTTLPPLTQNYSYHYSNDQSSHGAQSSQASYTSSTVTSGSQPGSYTYTSQLPSQYGAQTTYAHTPRQLPSGQDHSSLGHNAPAHQSYSTSSTHPGRLADIRPMPAGGSRDPSSLSTTHKVSSHQSLPQLSASQETEPTHVVGSQGRRGILPSADGRPVAVENSSDSKAANAGLRKDPDDGKWPCEHCNKRYLHAKHLKRHLLRHTGTRPYSCGLCKDTFSRSDILKRHFAKCSIRRGNPTGANHLTHSRATRRLKLEQDQDGSYHSAAQASLAESSSNPMDFAAMSGLGSISNLSNTDLAQPSFSEAQRPQSNHISRANSVKGPSKSTSSGNRGSYTAPNSAGLDSAGFSYSGGQATPDSLTTSGAATPFNYSNDPRSNPLSPHSSMNQSLTGLSLDLNSITRSLSGPNYSSGALPHIVEASHDRTGGVDWSLPHLDGSEDYSTAQYHNHTTGHHQTIKPDPHYSAGTFNMPHRYPSYQATKH